VYKCFSALTVALWIGLLVGCGGQTTENSSDKITTGYGRKSGSNYVNSVNGTAIFAQMIEASGDSVARAESISPRIDRFERIVWFRDRYEVPNQEAIDALEEWLIDGYDRQLIVVGRDYDSAIEYWSGVVEKASGDASVEARRRLARAKANFQKRRTGTAVERTECDWFVIEPFDYQTATRATGDWSNAFDIENADLKVGTVLQAPEQIPTMDWNDRYTIEVELELDSRPMVTHLSKREFSGGSIYVVSNSSFLTNYGLINHENRRLAQQLIDANPYYGSTLFLETDDSDTRVLTSESGHQTWAWIGKPPLRYMVPHFLMLGIFFCFVLFPIFGRAKRADTDKNPFTFRSHIKAMGKLMASSSNLGFARDKIEKYINRNRKEK
jgi:hypothetical protein